MLKTWISGNISFDKKNPLLLIQFSLIRMDMFLTQEWTDHRITVPKEMYDKNVDYVNLPVQYFSDLWQPDLYFLNSKIVGEVS